MRREYKEILEEVYFVVIHTGGALSRSDAFEMTIQEKKAAFAAIKRKEQSTGNGTQ